MKDSDFFTWRRDCFLRFQELTCADEVYQELQRQTQALEFDYYALCVRHPVPFTRQDLVQTTYPKQWMAQYQSANYFAIDPVLKPENFIQGHFPGLMHYSRMRRNYGMARGSRFTQGNNAVPDAANHALGFLSVSRTSVQDVPYSQEEIELRLQMLVQMALTTLLRFEDEMVMPPK
jgi:LuxR family transcriptional regulator